MKKLGLVLTIMLLHLNASFAGSACPKAVDLWIQDQFLQEEIWRLKTMGACEGSCTSADLPQMVADDLALSAAAKAAEEACHVGDQRSEASHMILCAEGNADSQIDPDGRLGGSMEACAPDMPSDSVRRLNPGLWKQNSDGRWIVH